MVLFLYTQMRILVRVNNKLYPRGGDWNLFIIYATDGIDRYGVDLMNITRLVNLSYDVLELRVGVNIGTYLSARFVQKDAIPLDMLRHAGRVRIQHIQKVIGKHMFHLLYG